MNRFHEILRQYWGYDSFRSLQEEIIQSVYDGKDTLGLMPTGGGKSLTFQVPALLMDGVCIVITPLIALMKDQVDALRAKGIKATCIHSGMSRQEIIVALENCVWGNYKFLYIAPERINTELFLDRLMYMNVCLIAVDESHCVSQWGYDFRPSYLRITKLRELLPEVPILALTASATPEVIEDIQEKLNFREKNVFKKSFYRSNLAYVIRHTEDKMFQIFHILDSVPGSAIIYVRNRKLTKEIALELQRAGISADYFHAGLTMDEKATKQTNWKENRCRVIVATNAFGMGIDKSDVRLVLHYELPSSLEEYFQEAGRAGRDGNKAYAVVLYSEKDKTSLKRRVKDTFPTKEFVLDVYEKLAYFFEIGMNMGAGTGHNFVLEEFCKVFKYNMTHVHSALKLLDLADYINYVEETDRRSKIKFTIHRDALYQSQGFKPDIDALLQVLLRSYTGLFADYIYINESLLSQRVGISVQEVYEHLKFLSSIQVVHYIPAKKIPVVYYCQNREELRYMNIPAEVYEDRRDRLKQRISQVLYYGSNELHCRSKVLLKYFGEKDIADCGYCDVCLSRKGQNFDDRKMKALMKDIMEYLQGGECELEILIKKFDSPRQQIIEAIRFLLDSDQIGIKKNVLSLN